MPRDNQRSTHELCVISHNAVSPPTKAMIRNQAVAVMPAAESVVTKDNINEEAAVMKPAFPSSISSMMMRRRTGCCTTRSDSVVVNPAPVKADRAWNRASCRESPVSVRATVAIRTTNKERMTTTSRVEIASMFCAFVTVKVGIHHRGRGEQM